MLTREELGGEAKDGVDELTLTDRIVLCDPADLAFSDCVHRLVAGCCKLVQSEQVLMRTVPITEKQSFNPQDFHRTVENSKGRIDGW